MNETEQANLRKWVANWKALTPVFERMRDEDIRNASTADAARAFTGGALAAARSLPPEPTSGLVEQQRWFVKARGASGGYGQP